MFRRFLEDRKTRKRVKAFLARDPDYLTREQQIELGLVPKWDLDWSPDFLWWSDNDDRVRRSRVWYIERSDKSGPRRPSRIPNTQTVHPAIAALRNTGGKPIGFVVTPPILMP